MTKMDLTGKWQGMGTDEKGNAISFDGSVPGCVHTDLIKNDMLEKDMYFNDNAEKVQWIENRDWTYKKEFELNKIPENPVLVFEGLDTYCRVILNGILLGECENMFLPYEFDVSRALRCGTNELIVEFDSPVRRAEGFPKRGAAFAKDRLSTRRMQCTYGWDWVARFVTCGIFLPVYLKSGSEMKVKDAYIYTQWADKESAQLAVNAELENYSGGGMVEICLKSPDGDVIYTHREYCCEPEISRRIDVFSPQLWYPAGYGEQPLYTLQISVDEAVWSRKTGIRTVKVIQKPDMVGDKFYELCEEIKKFDSSENDLNKSFSGFLIKVNDVPVFCKGGNWVPCEPFPSEVTEEKITALLELSAQCGVNTVRVWGGGLFETEHFYNECDRLGFLVMQDFMLACGDYPDHEEWFIKHIKDEAVFAIKKLRNHPCLIIWIGSNENSGDGSYTDEYYMGRNAVVKVFRPLVAKYDPLRLYMECSPFGGSMFCSKTCGTTHNSYFLGHAFEYMNNSDASDYREWYKQFGARFIVEEPTFGAVSDISLKRMMPEEELCSDDMWLYHSKGNPALSKELYHIYRDFARKLFGDFENDTDRRFKLKYLQYEFIRLGMEQVRRSDGFCTGIIYWMLNDCWPAAAGWALLDYYALPKASYYAFKKYSNTVIGSVDKDNNGICVPYVCSIDTDDCTANVRALKINKKTGEVISQKDAVVFVPAGRSVAVNELQFEGDGELFVLETEHNEKCDRTFYKSGILKLKESNALSVLKQTGNTIVLKANSYIHAVEMEGAAIFDDNYFSMLTGEERTVNYRSVDGNKLCDDLIVRAFTLYETENC